MKIATVRIMPAELAALIKAVDVLPAMPSPLWSEAEIRELANARTALLVARVALRAPAPIDPQAAV